MGYMDFNGQRYFDIRHNNDIYYPLNLLGLQALPSDSTRREDSNVLATGELDKAQRKKEEKVQHSFLNLFLSRPYLENELQP